MKQGCCASPQVLSPINQYLPGEAEGREAWRTEGVRKMGRQEEGRAGRGGRKKAGWRERQGGRQDGGGGREGEALEKQ